MKLLIKVYATLGKAAKVAEIKDKVELEAKDTNIVQALLLKSQGDLGWLKIVPISKIILI